MSPTEVSLRIAKQVQAKRLSLNYSQRTLAHRSGVSYGALKKFERTGQISLVSLLKLALTVECLEAFDNLFPVIDLTKLTCLEALMKEETRQRGRG